MSAELPASAPIEALRAGDVFIECYAVAYDAILPGLGDVLRDIWPSVRPQPTCDCPMDPYHRWNCDLTPIWAQTIRDLDCNPWTVIRPNDLAMVNTRFKPFQWDGEVGRYCGKGPCCMFDGHDGRCRM